LRDLIETSIEAPGPLGPLRGTLLVPQPPGGPVVLIVPGSGPTDRDGNGPLGLHAASYRLLAEGLAAKGVATVRIDKRGMFGSADAVADANAVTIKAYAADVHSWIDAIRSVTRASCIWVLGHSEGGLVALAAAQGDADICGLILVAAAGRPLGQVLRDQLMANPANAPFLDQALWAVEELEAGRHVDVATMHPAVQSLFAPDVQDFVIDIFRRDPATMIAECEKPILILQGERDIQVGVQDAERLKRAAPNATLRLLPNTNHLLKEVRSDDRAANLATYTQSAPLAPGVVDAIAAFLSANVR
jgi:pimeloyl-ACP methyl ester carboxylesterase